MTTLLIILISYSLNIIVDLKITKLKFTKEYTIKSIIQLLIGSSLLIVINLMNSQLSIIGQILILFALFFIIKQLFYYKNIKKLFKKSHSYQICLIIILGIFIEMLIGSFNFVSTLNYNPKNLYNGKITKNVKIKTSNTQTVVEILNINKQIKNIYIDTEAKSIYDLDIFATDKGNKLYFPLPKREVYNKIEKSKYIRLHLSGESEKIYLKFSFNKYTKINEILINQNVPLLFNSARAVIIMFICFFVYLFRSKSSLYKIKLEHIKHNKCLICLLLVINIGIFSLISYKSLLTYADIGFPDCYNRLAESLINHKVYVIDHAVGSESLLNQMDNPYDMVLRDRIFKEHNKRFMWDFAFFRGKYYVYFGVVPALMYHIPYQLIYHRYMPTTFACYIAVILTLVFLAILLYQIVRKFYKNCSVGVYILINLLVTYCIGLIYLMKYANQYSLPIITALMFIFLGLNLFLGILKSNKLIKTKMFFGSLSLALVAGCRPQLLLSSFLIIPILISYYKDNKNKINKKDLLKYATFVSIPYLIVAAMLMKYNYLRFGSIFDFGANYNLTTNDMTVRGFNLARIPLGIFVYLFNLANFNNVFPFIQEAFIHTNYMGLTIVEKMYGGLFFGTLIFAVALFLPKFKLIINNKTIYRSCWLMLLSAFIIIIFDTEAAGILTRYFSDFSWLFAGISTFIIFSIENENFKYKNIFHKILFSLITLALVYQICLMFVQMRMYGPAIWIYGKYIIQFWI